MNRLVLAILLLFQLPPTPTPQPGTLVVSSLDAVSSMSIEGSEGYVASFSVRFPDSHVERRTLGGQRCIVWQDRHITCAPAPSGTFDTETFSLQTGDYQLHSTTSGCDGNCGNLGPPEQECTASFSIRSNETLYARRENDGGCKLRFSSTAPYLPPALISGQINFSDGTPAAHIRVGAIPLDQMTQPVYTFLAVETDAAGRYRMIRLPSKGQHYLVAYPSLTLPTYFPGVPDQAAATAITVDEKSALAALNFSARMR